MDDIFFKNYEKEHKQSVGIPGFSMNEPIAKNTLPGQIGLELEIEPKNGYRLPRSGHLEKIISPETKAMWTIVEDHSLRNGGMEYIFSQPVKQAELEGMLKGLFEAFTTSSCPIENSNRCSTHVHKNVSGRTINQLTSIIVLWAVFEELLIQWCGEERQTNHFCLSTKDTLSLINQWDQLLRVGHGNFTRDLKYSALNVLPVWDKGSFEFRCGPAASDWETPFKWATFINTFVDYTCETFENPEQIAFAMSERGGIVIFDEICSKSSVLKDFRTEVVGTLSYDEFNASCMDGFRNVQKLALGYPWSKWMDLIKREFVPNPFATKTIKKKPLFIDPPTFRERLVEAEEAQRVFRATLQATNTALGNW